MTTRAFAVVIFGFLCTGAGFLILALCRSASARDLAYQETWERHRKEIETDYYEEHA